MCAGVLCLLAVEIIHIHPVINKRSSRMGKVVRIILLICVAVLYGTMSVHAGGNKAVFSIDIPDKLGKVKERYVGKTDSIIVHIQDAHTSFEAQKNIAYIIEFLIQKEKLNLVGIEGDAGPVDMSYYRGFPFENTVNETALLFVKNGIFTGAEYAQVVASEVFDLVGIEDKELMSTNYKAFLQSLKVREDAVAEFVAIDEAVLLLEKNMVNPALQDFLMKLEDYEDHMTDFVDYSAELIVAAQEKQIDLMQYPNIKQYTDYIAEKDALDLDKLEAEKDDLLRIIEKRKGELDEKSAYLKLRKSLDGENKLFTGKEIDEMVIVLARYLSIPQEQYATLEKNISLERRFQTFNIGVLIKEADELTYDVLFALTENGTEERLLKMRRAVKTIMKTITLSALAHDTEYFMTKRDTFIIDSWYTFLDNELKRVGKEPIFDKRQVDYDTLFDAVNTYYSAAAQRDDVLAVNMMKLTEDKGVRIGVMVCGGYHTSGITEKFREMGQSYVVIMPRITSAAEDIPLEDRLTGKLFDVDMYEKMDVK